MQLDRGKGRIHILLHIPDNMSYNKHLNIHNIPN